MRQDQAVQDVAALLRARNTLVWVVSGEELRVERALIGVGESLGMDVRFWDCADGIQNGVGDTIERRTDPLQALDYVKATKQRSLYVFRDLHKWLDPQVLRSLRSLARRLQGAGRNEARAIIVLTPSTEIPPELTGQVSVVDWPLPDRDEMGSILDNVLASLDESLQEEALPKNGAREAAIDAAVGLSAEEAMNSYARSLVTERRINPAIVSAEKKRVIARERVLTWYEPDPRGLDAVGGLDVLKDWLIGRKAAFSPRAREYGLPAPKGALLVGPPGCVAGDAEVLYLRGSRNSGRAITLEEFYRKFNGIPTSTRPWVDLTVPTFLHSMDEDGRVFYNRVVAVTQSGAKPLWRLTLSGGTALRLTPDHPVAVPDGGFVPAASLSTGDKVLARGSMKPVPQGRHPLSERPERVIVNTKHHPGPVKVVNGYEFVRVPKARLVIEARMNDLEYDEFVHALKHNAEASAGFRYLPADVDVHHIDEDPLNDEVENLMVLPHSEHARVHGKIENFNIDHTRSLVVESSEPDGEGMTYDVQMDYPANNFCAEGIIVHNTGKSLTAKAIGTAWGQPLLRLDLGALRSKYVGDSEANIRKALSVAETVAPCILWADEIEKALAGATGPQGDGGVGADALGTILSWMQEQAGGVFVVATANDVSALPPELLRKGRFDELFFIDLPQSRERAEILKAALAKYGQDPAVVIATKKVADELVARTENFTGAEIESVVPDAMFRAFSDGERALRAGDLLASLKTVVPLATTAGERIESLRRWAKGRARFASSPEASNGSPDRAIEI